MTIREEFRNAAKRLAQSIDFEDLIARGLLKKKGARYWVRNIHELPKHVTDKIVETESTKGVPGILVKFKLPTKPQSKAYGHTAN